MSRRDEGHLVLLILKKKGPMTKREVKEHFFKFASQFGYGFDHTHHDTHAQKRRDDYFKSIDQQIEIFQTKGLLKRQDEQLQLTQAGLNEAGGIEKRLNEKTEQINRHILSAEGATRNTVIIDAILAVIKLLTGFISGSLGLIADGTDAALDTVTAGVVHWSVKKKKELIGSFVITAMMFATAAGIGVDSFTSIINALQGEAESITRPGLVIVVESIALVFAVLLSIYQRFVGKKKRSLALISQSIDSKNHIYVAAAVIAGAIFSNFGIHFVDSAIGAYIAVRIFIDAFNLLKETFSSMQGEEIDFDKYSGHIDKKWQNVKKNAFMATIIYGLLKDEPLNKQALISNLEETFKPEYMPLISEFQLGIASNADFKKTFPAIIAPLINRNIVIREGDSYRLKREKRIEIEEYISNTFIEETKPHALKNRVDNLYHNDYDAIDGLGRTGDYLDEDETIIALTRGKYGKQIHLLLITDRKLHLFSRRGKRHQAVTCEDITGVSEKSGRFSTTTLTLQTTKGTYTFSYLSRKKAFGFINELKRQVALNSGEAEMETDDEFTQRIKVLHRIQRYLQKHKTGAYSEYQ